MMSRDDGHVRPSHPVIEPIRVLIADDEAVVRGGFRVLIDAEPGMIVVGEAGDGPPRWNWPGRPTPTSC
jgi:hypothetical protein